MCLRSRAWTRILVAAVVFRLAATDQTSTRAPVNVTAITTTQSASATPTGLTSKTYLSTVFATRTLTTLTSSTISTKPTESSITSQQTSTSKEPKRVSALKLHRANRNKGNDMLRCLNGCSSSRCRDSCLRREMSDEEIVERTQRCHNDCKDEPEELIQMCIQKCTYYLINPVDHSLEGDGDEDSSTDTHGLLPDSPHIRTRIRLIGPDGLPIISTVEYDETQASEMSDAVSTAAESASDTWMPVYRVSIVNEATGIKWLGWLQAWCTVVAIFFALYV